jgi:serine/threonine protein kinase
LKIEKKEIGRGDFGIVRRAKAKEICANVAETEVAVKVCLKDINSLIAIADELRIMIHLQKVKNQTHPNIIQLLGAITKNTRDLEIFAITEFCHFGNMKSFIEKNSKQFINQLNEIGVIDKTLQSLSNSMKQT